MLKPIPLILVAGTLLAACSAGPDFARPEAPKTKAYVSAQDALPEGLRIAVGRRVAAEWWQLFASPDLDRLIRQAVSGNYDLATARQTLARAEALTRAENGGFWPQASLGAVAGRQKYGIAQFGPANFTIPPFNYYEIGPSVSWTPDLSGGQRRRVERAEALAEYQAHELDAAYVALTGNVVDAALDIATGRDEIAAVGQIVAEDEKTLHLTEAAYAAGVGTRVDILSAQSQLIADQAELPPLEQRLSVARHALSVLVGRAPADWVPPDLDLDAFAMPRELPLRLPSELVRKRPDILAAEADLHAASAAVGVAAANRYPSITLSADLLQEALTPAGLFQSGGAAWSLAGSVAAPLFSGGRLTAEKAAAEHAYQASLAQYRQTVLVAFRQVADALTALAHDDEAVAARRAALVTADVALDLARKAYQAGSSGLLQVEDAQRQLARARLGLIAAQSQRYRDGVALFVALGGSPLGKP